MPIHPAPSPLSIDIHRNRKQTNTNRKSTNSEEDVSRPLRCEPIVDIIHESESEEVLDEVHCGKRFTCFVTMAIYDVGDYACGAELDAEVDQSEPDDHGYFPGVESVGCLAPGEEAGRGE